MVEFKNKTVYFWTPLDYDTTYFNPPHPDIQIIWTPLIPRPPPYWRIKKDQPLNENLKIFQFLKKCMFHKFQTFRVITSFTLVFFFTFVFFMRTLTYFPIAQPLKIVSFDQNHLLPSFFHHKKRKKMVFLFYLKVNVFGWRHHDKILH